MEFRRGRRTVLTVLLLLGACAVNGCRSTGGGRMTVRARERTVPPPMFQRVRLINESDLPVVSVKVRPSPAIPIPPGTWGNWPTNYEFDLLPATNDQLPAPNGGPNVPPFPFLPFGGCPSTPAILGAAVLVTYANGFTQTNHIPVSAPPPGAGMEELTIRIVGSGLGRTVDLEATYGGPTDCAATYIVFNPFPRD